MDKLGLELATLDLAPDALQTALWSPVRLSDTAWLMCQSQQQQLIYFFYVFSKIDEAHHAHEMSSLILSELASVAHLDAPSDWRPGGHGFNPRRGRQHSFVEIDHEIFSTVILSLPLIQEGQLPVSGGRMCTILVNRLED